MTTEQKAIIEAVREKVTPVCIHDEERATLGPDGEELDIDAVSGLIESQVLLRTGARFKGGKYVFQEFRVANA